jgi:hypothetical protein
VAGCEILRHCQGLTPLVEGGGGFGGSPASSGGSKIVWVLGGASYIFQVSQGVVCKMGIYCATG